jgi:hypothetical protein
MASGDSVVFSFGVRVSMDDSATLAILAKAFEKLASWGSYKKTPRGTIARLELSLANSSAISFFRRKICKYTRLPNCSLTCEAPSSIVAFCYPNMITLCWPDL